MKQTITTYGGLNVSKDICRKINDVYYLIGDVNEENSGECYYIDGTYYRTHKGKIQWDAVKKQYLVIEEWSWRFGITGYDKTGYPTIGYSTVNMQSDITTGTGSDLYRHLMTLQSNYKNNNLLGVQNLVTGNCFRIGPTKFIRFYTFISKSDTERLPNLKSRFYFSEEISIKVAGGIWSLESRQMIDKSSISLDHILVRNWNFDSSKPVDKRYKRSLPYNLNSSIMKDASYRFRKGETSIPSKASLKNNYEKVIQDLCKDLTYGIEMETISGFIPEDICKDIGLVALRDGSVEGLEYASIPYKDDEIVDAAINISKALTENCSFDDSCSFHLHIGGIPRTESFIVAFTRMLPLFEKMSYAIMPKYKKENKGYKNKNYTKPFPFLAYNMAALSSSSINEQFNIIKEILINVGIGSTRNEKIENIKAHPSDPDGNRKWQVTSRYLNVNMIPIIFGNKQTIEFRMHDATYNPNNMLNWIVLCSAFVSFVKQYEDDILNKKGITSSVLHMFDRMIFNEDYSESGEVIMSKFLDLLIFKNKVIINKTNNSSTYSDLVYRFKNTLFRNYFITRNRQFSEKKPDLNYLECGNTINTYLKYSKRKIKFSDYIKSGNLKYTFVKLSAFNDLAPKIVEFADGTLTSLIGSNLASRTSSRRSSQYDQFTWSIQPPSEPENRIIPDTD